MNIPNNNIRFAQSASALGTGLLGFGIGAKWGAAIDNTILLIVLILVPLFTLLACMWCK